MSATTIPRAHRDAVRNLNENIIAFLPTGGLLFVLQVRPKAEFDNDNGGKYHRCLYPHHDRDVGGMKYHLRGGAGKCLHDFAMARGLFNSTYLVGILRIAMVPRDRMNYFEEQVHCFDDSLFTQSNRGLDLPHLGSQGPRTSPPARE
ncbi:hypothetical protein BDV96DRAFT_647134 [Lophiotrema nucula]|uniref:Uncharacterized protein n=1 Tax=Lophiotrema nucula TaxID=690887 RepID=A0A6A5Z6J1_9PLEO|nr:hypothetical protein BDV96DRAFT_647134 [Lophiotrema nucula]